MFLKNPATSHMFINFLENDVKFESITALPTKEQLAFCVRKMGVYLQHGEYLMAATATRKILQEAPEGSTNTAKSESTTAWSDEEPTNWL